MNVNVETGDLVKWCFSSLDKDLFQVAFVTEGGVAQTVFPPVACAVEGIAGDGRMAMPGGWTDPLVLDNSKSSWYSCSVSYEVTIEKESQ